MPQYREPIFHDRQSMESIVPQSTSDTGFTDVSGATLTTGDLSQDGVYLIWTPVLIQASLNNTIASFRVTANGMPIGNVSTVDLKVKDLDVGITFQGRLSVVPPGAVLQLQYATSTGTLTLQEYSIMIDGIPTVRLI